LFASICSSITNKVLHKKKRMTLVSTFFDSPDLVDIMSQLDGPPGFFASFARSSFVSTQEWVLFASRHLCCPAVDWFLPLDLLGSMGEYLIQDWGTVHQVKISPHSSFVLAPWTVCDAGQCTDGRFSTDTGIYIVPKTGRYQVHATLHLPDILTPKISRGLSFNLHLGTTINAKGGPDPAKDPVLLQTSPYIVLAGLTTLEMSNMNLSLAGVLYFKVGQFVYLTLHNSSHLFVDESITLLAGQTIFSLCFLH
jgi:hypothetical protein